MIKTYFSQLIIYLSPYFKWARRLRYKKIPKDVLWFVEKERRMRRKLRRIERKISHLYSKKVSLLKKQQALRFPKKGIPYHMRRCYFWMKDNADRIHFNGMPKVPGDNNIKQTGVPPSKNDKQSGCASGSEGKEPI